MGLDYRDPVHECLGLDRLVPEGRAPVDRSKVLVTRDRADHHPTEISYILHRIVMHMRDLHHVAYTGGMRSCIRKKKEE